MRIRCVVTGHDANGKAVFASDMEVEPITVALLPGTEFYPCGEQINRAGSLTMARSQAAHTISHRSAGSGSDYSRLHPTRSQCPKVLT
jgi:hypothetical protein